MPERRSSQQTVDSRQALNRPGSGQGKPFLRPCPGQVFLYAVYCLLSTLLTVSALGGLFAQGVSAPAIQEENFAGWGEGVMEFLGQLQEGPPKSLHDFQEEMVPLKDAVNDESQGVSPQIEGATLALWKGEAQLKAYKYKEANANLRESAGGYELAIKGLSGNSSLEAMVWYNLGHVYTHLAEWERAGETLLKAMDMQKLSGKEKDLANTYNSLGIVALKRGDKASVIHYFEESISLARRAGFPQVEAAALGNMGVVYYLKGNPKKALQSYEAAIKIQRKLGHRPWEAKYLSSQGFIYHLQGKLEQALHAYKMALRINREIGNKREEASNLGSMGVIYNFQKKPEESLDAYATALSIHRNMGLRSEAAKDLSNIGIVYQSQGRLEEALNAYKESLQIHKMLHDLRGEAKDLNNVAVICQAQGKMEEALAAYEEAYNLFQFIKSPVELEVVKGNIARIKAQLEGRATSDSGKGEK
ncbi:MAG TPA: tetratricopeptide repeat protein [Candidatus Tripitaka sp. YC43]